MIHYNIPLITGREVESFQRTLSNKKFSGDGPFTKLASSKLEELHQFIPKKVLLTTSCTDALEMISLLLNINNEDEIIVPSYTFVSTALAFEMRGAKIIFADSMNDSPHISLESIKSLVTNKTKAIVVVSYAGYCRDLESIQDFCKERNIYLIEDNAQGIRSYYKERSLGTFGTFSTLSFHESKNIHCGEGGALIINDDSFMERAEIIREKGTNRASFFRGEVNKYGWYDLGSSYLMSDILASFLFSQLNVVHKIINKRINIFDQYYHSFSKLKELEILLPIDYTGNNGHIFYLVTRSLEERINLINHLYQNDISAVTHYRSLHQSEYFQHKYSGFELKNSDHFSDCLVRLPLYYSLDDEDIKHIIKCVLKFYGV